MAAKKQKKTSGGFKWDPVSFDVAEQHVAMVRNGTGIGPMLAKVMPQAIRIMGQVNGLGGLTCPSPPNDPNGVYRVGLDAQGVPQIQKRDPQGVWQPYP
jgi:hypothetical protein